MFYIREVFSVQEQVSLIETFNEWGQAVDVKSKICSFQEKQIVEDHTNITKTFKDYLAVSFSGSDRRIFVCNGPSGLVQAASSVEEDGDYLNLKFLIANPSCMRSGAGRAVVETLFQECLRQNKKGVVTMSMISSVPFYQKMGFKGLVGFSEEEGGYMRITAEKIQLKKF